MIKLAQPNIPPQAIENAVEVLKSGNLVQGKYVAKFEKAICHYLNTKHAVLVSSGTAALHLSLMSLGIKEGDEVILPAFTFPATANVVELVRAKPVLVDVNLSDFCLDTTKIIDNITPQTKAIIPVHEFGQSVKMDDVIEIANKYNLKIIEDAACALGAKFEKKFAGTFGNLGCFSFHPRKAITTGEGGVVVTDNDKLAEKLIALRNHGLCASNGKYDLKFIGLNYRMTDFQAALGLYQLEKLEDNISYRIVIARGYDKYLSKVKWIKIPQTINNRRMIYQTYHILLDDFIDRNSLINYLQTCGVEVNYGANAINCLEYYKKKYNLNPEKYINATKLFRKGLSLPMGSHILKKDIKYICEKIKNFSQHL